MIKVLIQTYMCVTLVSAMTFKDYQINRSEILELESAYSLGGGTELTNEELKVNDILMTFKQQEFNDSFYHPKKFNYSNHYFVYKDYIRNSEVYKIIEKMPKGAALHTHATFLMDADFLLTLTYEDHLYVCYTKYRIEFQFDKQVPNLPCEDADWILLSALRNLSDDVNVFDADLKKHLTLVDSQQEDRALDITSAWEKFDNIHKTTKSLISYRPLREKFIYRCLQKFYDDNILYVEMRSGLVQLYELNGTRHDHLYTIQLYRDVTQRFIKDHPDFIGMKLIISKHRSAPISAIKYTLNKAKEIKKEFPDMFAGFDLVGQEDKGKPLIDFIPLLLEAKNDLNYYFHAGETNWYGTSTDENLVDAILLGSKRIGHGYALAKHPFLVNMIKKADIAVEVNVISNAVLALVGDIRNHPLAVFLSLNLPIVLSSDDPGVWGAEPLSHDFYISFIAVASQRADLRLLKQLALNSITYSALDNKRKSKLLSIFTKRWKLFLKQVLDRY